MGTWGWIALGVLAFLVLASSGKQKPKTAGRAEKKTTEPASGKEETSGTAAPAGGRLFLPAGKEEEAETVVTIYQRRKAWPVRNCPVCGTENGLAESVCGLCGQPLTEDMR